MSYDRYEGRRPSRSRFGSDEQSNRFRDDRFDREDRGFFERAGDEIASWFGDEEAERRRRYDNRFGSQDDQYRQPRSSYDDDRQGDRSARYRDEGYRRPYTGRQGSQELRAGSSSSSYRPLTGDYGRSAEYGDNFSSGQNRFDRGSSQSESSNYGSSSATGGAHDPHYSEWRSRQIDALDRDYDDYRRENQSRFESEFSNWRNQRQTKRQMLGNIREHMEVVGSDEQPVGKVDKVRGDRVILTKSDSDDNMHHSINCAMIDRVEGDRVFLDKSAEEAKRHWTNEDRDRALFERDDIREPGAHMLNRSFSGTY